MNLCKTAFFSFLLIGILFSVNGNSQFRNWDRFELGGNFVLASGQYNGVSSLYDGSGNFKGDTTVQRSIMTKLGYGVFIGTCIPFKRLGHESLWAISIGFMANQLIWADLNSVYNAAGSLAANTSSVGTINGLTTQFALPFGIEYKVGTDAIKTQRSKLGASFGIGLMPIMNSTVVEGIKDYDEHGSGFNYGFDPYVKAEVAAYMGICIKLRAMFSYGNLNYMYESSNVGKYNDGPMRITGTYNLVATLIVMPWSHAWDEHSWYNTYDTYNPFDKLH